MSQSVMSNVKAAALLAATLFVLLGFPTLCPAQRPGSFVQPITPKPSPSPTPQRAAAATASPVNDPAAEREAYNLANALHTAGKYTEAVPALRTFLARFPNSADTVEITYKLADSLRRTDPNSDEARQLFLLITQRHPDSPYAPFANMRLAEELLTRQNFQEALPLLDRVIASAPTQGLRLNAIYSKILALHALNRLEETPDLLDQLTSVRENNPYLPFAELALGRYYESRQQHTDALRHYNRALAIATDPALRAEAGTRAAVAALRDGDAAEAFRLFDTTLRLDPPEPWLRLSRIGLIRALAAANRYDELLRSAAAFGLPATAETALQPELHYLIGTAYRLKTPPDTTRATENLSAIVQKFPDSPYAQHAAFELILLRSSGAKNDSMITPLRNYIENYPSSPHIPAARQLLAGILLADGRTNEARPLLEQNLRDKQPADALPDILLQLSYIHLADKHPDKALPLLIDFLDNNPDHPQTENALQLTAIAQEALGEFPDALATWDTLLTRFPRTIHRAEALHRSGLIHARAERWPEALRAFNGALNADPAHPRAMESYFWRGLAAQNTGDRTSAQSDFTHVVEKTDPNDPLHTPALQQLITLAAADKDIERADPLARSYQSLAETNPELPALTPELLHWLAQTRAEMRQFTDADYWFSRLITTAKDNRDLTTLALLGALRARVELRRATEALEAWELLQKHDPTIAAGTEAQLLHAAALLQANRPQESLPVAEQILSDTRDPVLSARARVLLGDIHTALQQPHDALRYYSSAALLYDDPELTPTALRKAASTARSLGQNDEAARHEADLRRRFPHFQR